MKSDIINECLENDAIHTSACEDLQDHVKEPKTELENY